MKTTNIRKIVVGTVILGGIAVGIADTEGDCTCEAGGWTDQGWKCIKNCCTMKQEPDDMPCIYYTAAKDMTLWRECGLNPNCSNISHTEPDQLAVYPYRGSMVYSNVAIKVYQYGACWFGCCYDDAGGQNGTTTDKKWLTDCCYGWIASVQQRPQTQLVHKNSHIRMTRRSPLTAEQKSL